MAGDSLANITRCPECATTFRVTPDQLDAAAGMVRCGACLQVFLASDHMVRREQSIPPLDVEERTLATAAYWDNFQIYAAEAGSRQSRRLADSGIVFSLAESAEPDEATVSTGPVSALSFRPANEADLALVASGDDDDSLQLPPADTDALTALAQAPALPGDALPDLDLDHAATELAVADIEPPRPTRLWLQMAWLMAVLVLMSGLAAQALWRDREALAEDPAYRDKVILACRYLPCQLPDYVNLDTLQTSNLVVRSHPEVDGALLIDALIRNQDVLRQPFPLIQLEFTDTRERVVAARRFAAAEYLAGEMKGMRFIPGRTEVRISLEVLDPGGLALGYRVRIVSAR